MARRARWLARAEQAVDEHTAPAANDRKYVHGPEADLADREVLRREQVDEMADAWPSFGSVSGAQRTGAVVGTLAGAVIGAIVFLPLGLFSWGGLGLGWRLAGAALCGALAGATALAVYLGGREPELEGETQDVDGRPSIGTSLRDPGTDRRGR